MKLIFSNFIFYFILSILVRALFITFAPFKINILLLFSYLRKIYYNILYYIMKLIKANLIFAILLGCVLNKCEVTYQNIEIETITDDDGKQSINLLIAFQVVILN
jgi:hypothetical protein